MSLELYDVSLEYLNKTINELGSTKKINVQLINKLVEKLGLNNLSGGAKFFLTRNSIMPANQLAIANFYIPENIIVNDYLDPQFVELLKEKLITLIQKIKAKKAALKSVTKTAASATGTGTGTGTAPASQPGAAPGAAQGTAPASQGTAPASQGAAPASQGTAPASQGAAQGTASQPGASPGAAQGTASQPGAAQGVADI